MPPSTEAPAEPASQPTPDAPNNPAPLPPPPKPSVDPAASAPTRAKEPWKRADRIAIGALIVAVAGIVIAVAGYIDTHRSNANTDDTSKKALKVAQQADARSQVTDHTTFEAMVMLIDERVNQIDDATDDASSQLKAIGRGAPDDLMIRPNKGSLAFVGQLAERIPSLDLTVDQITALAKGQPGIAATVTQCVRMRDQLVADLQGYKGATISGQHLNGVDLKQELAFPVLPVRIERVHGACWSAAKQLTSLIPHQFKDGDDRGSLAELSDAQAEGYQDHLDEIKHKKHSRPTHLPGTVRKKVGPTDRGGTHSM